MPGLLGARGKKIEKKFFLKFFQNILFQKNFFVSNNSFLLFFFEKKSVFLIFF